MRAVGRRRRLRRFGARPILRSPHGALADGARIQARYADALESMAPRVGDDAAAAVTNGTVAALAAHLAAFLESCGYLESTGAEALGRLAREADYPLPTYVKNA